MKKILSLALASAHNQRMLTIDRIFERCERIFDEKAIFFVIIVCMSLLALIFYMSNQLRSNSPKQLSRNKLLCKQQMNFKTKHLGLKIRMFCFCFVFFRFFIWIICHDHSRVTGLQGKEEGVSLTPHYKFHPLHKYLDISWAITTGSSPLHIGSSWTWTKNLWFPSASR